MSNHRHLSAATAAALLGLPVAAALAQQAGSGVAAGEGTSSVLRERLLISEASIKALTESLAIANGEAEVFKRKSEDLNERVEALGIAPAGKETDIVRDRLLAAVRDLRLLQKENDTVRDHLVALSESVMEMLKTTEGIDAKSRSKVEAELRSAAAALHKSDTAAVNSTGLTSGTVVDYKPNLSLVVANLGSRQGVKTGMPFQVWRGDREIASVRVVDVRDAISGAIVQSTATPSMNVQAGDTLRIDTTR
jgi:hypothetical protein